MTINQNICNHDLFDKWSEESAYILGFWMADGCIMLKSDKSKDRPNRGCRKVFSITNTDKQIMDDISKILRHSYRTQKPQPQQINWKTLYDLRCHSNKLFDFCYNITNTIYKSHSKFPLPTIPPKYFNHFIRGFFDGDGSIHYKHYKNRHGKPTIALSTSFSGGNETSHMEQLRDWFRDNIGLGNKMVTKGVSKKLVYNQYDSMLLCNFMYKDATIFMKRKKDIWDAADKTKLMNSPKYFSNKV